MIRLITLDAGSTLGKFGRYGTGDLMELSPLPKARVKEAARRFLHCTPEPTPEVLEDFCEATLIDPARLRPRSWRCTRRPVGGPEETEQPQTPPRRPS